MVVAGTDPCVERGGCTYLRYILCGGRTGNPPDWVRDVVDDPPHGANLGGFPPPRVLEPHREAPVMPHGQGVVYPPLEDALMGAGLE